MGTSQESLNGSQSPERIATRNRCEVMNTAAEHVAALSGLYEDSPVQPVVVDAANRFAPPAGLGSMVNTEQMAA